MDEEIFELEEADWAGLGAKLGRLRLPDAFCPYEPTAKQEWFLIEDALESFFGGAAGPGKSWGLLMAALMYVDVPGYDALILRTVLQDFKKPGALIEVANEWLGPTDASWNGSDYKWTFPSGATLSFGYIRTVADLSHYKGPAYSFLGFDELTEFEERVYLGMSRVLRAPPLLSADAVAGDPAFGLRVPLRKRSASNPGGPGHSWVKNRFVDPETRDPDAVFVRATIHDNPHMDYDEYLLSLAHLHPVDQMRLINGDWDVAEEGGKFRREDFIQVDLAEVPRPQKAVRYWDLAATEPSVNNSDPDWTAGMLVTLDRDGLFTIRDIVRGRWPDHKVEEQVLSTARLDGRGVAVYIEQDPGQAGKSQVNHYKRNILRGFACHAGLTKVAGKSAAKEVRARPVAAAVGNRLVRIVRGPNLLEFLNEAAIFPEGGHDDMVDTLSGGHTALTAKGTRGGGSSVPRARIPDATIRSVESAVGMGLPGL